MCRHGIKSMEVWAYQSFFLYQVSYVNADYIVQVRTHSYSNPTNWCYACRIDDEDDEYGCCDTFSQTQCSGDQLCENQFYYCLRPFGSVGDECTGGRMSTFNNNDEDIDFTQSVVLGLPNPLPLASTSLRWNVSRYHDWHTSWIQ